MDYEPDSWVVLEIQTPGEVIHKVLAGFSSGFFMKGGSWRLNSGITEIKEEGDYFLFYGYSGSVYKCHKHCYGLCLETSSVFNNIERSCPDVVKLLDEDTNWLELELGL